MDWWHSARPAGRGRLLRAIEQGFVEEAFAVGRTI